MLDQLLDLLQLQCLFLEQGLRNKVHFFGMLGQKLFTALIHFGNEAMHLLIDFISDLITVILFMADIAAQEHLTLRGAELHRSKLLTHTVFNDHAAYNTCRLLEVTVSSCADLTDKQLFGDTAAKKTCYLVEQFLLGDKHPVFLRKHNDISASTPPWNNRNLVHHIRMLQEVTNDRMPGFVISNDPLLAVTDHAAAFLGTNNHAVDGLIHFPH
ncbi:hypothetical protein D3C77_465400 [compost metagenome]